MHHCFVETSGFQPHFYVFNKVFEAGEKLNFDHYLCEFASNYDALQQKSFLEFWHLNGDSIVKEEYWRKEDKREFVNTDETGTEAYDYTEEANAKYTEIKKHWQQLYKNVYAEQYTIFAFIFYQYYQHLHQSLKEDIEIEENVEIGQKQIDDQSFLEEFKQLELLGLPTAFGGVQKKRKRHSNSNKQQEQIYSGFFSDEEHECMNMDIEIEEDLVEKTKFGIKKTIRKKINRKLRDVPDFLLERKGMLKYWRKRFSLFSRYDDGIRLDFESWFSVTPEKIATHLANRLQCDLIIDAFCGCGGNAIQFARTCKRVMAIDIDPAKLSMAKHNARIYGVADKIDFINGDFLEMGRSGRFRGDVVFLSPPWGGPKYKQTTDYDIENLQPAGASKLMEIARNICEHVVFYLPRNACVKEVIKLAGKGNRCELEHNYLDSRLVAVTALYGNTVRMEK